MEERFAYKFGKYEYNELIEYLNKKGYKNINPTGSLRRGKNDIGDIDFIVECDDEEKLLKVVSEYSEVKYAINKYEFMLKCGISIHTIPEKKEWYSYTLWQSTGPKPHVKWIKKEWYKKFGEELKECEIDEKKIYIKLDMEYIEPENRWKWMGNNEEKR